ncbi:MAG: hydrogenase nickel incorporation protein HypB [Deltaproteobacteria bacterium]|nr:hydrogenase nickel incorporation protein HypB [Deltaproteobacteria bacterium]
MKVKVVKKVLDANDRIAEENRKLFDQHKIFVINLMSSPGAGKTSLVEQTIKAIKNKYKIAVIEGDIQDTYDADRIAKLKIPVVQINTGGACHIDGNMIREALPSFDLNKIDLLIVENVGNLVCPAEFKIGENIKVMLLSTPEGADKPAKYPLMFQESAALLINKMDLISYVDFDLKKARHDSLSLNKKLKIFEVSCKTAAGLEAWIAWLTQRIDEFKK